VSADLGVTEGRTLLARAFADDPLMAWFFPDAESRPHAIAALFGVFTEHYLREGRVDVVRRAAPVAVAMWRWPSAAVPRDEPESLPSAPGLMRALLGPERAAEKGEAMAALADLRLPEPHAYLHLLAVDPQLHGQGLGGEVLRPGLAAAREAGLVACLETMNPANVPFYQAHGFVLRHKVQLAAGGPTAWGMATAAPGADQARS
jgi:GNAT superfamily N-acetyltransferase